MERLFCLQVLIKKPFRLLPMSLNWQLKGHTGVTRSFFLLSAFFLRYCGPTSNSGSLSDAEFHNKHWSHWGSLFLQDKYYIQHMSFYNQMKMNIIFMSKEVGDSECKAKWNTSLPIQFFSPLCHRVLSLSVIFLSPCLYLC